MKNFERKICPRCGMPKLKAWEDLSEEQKFLAEKLPLSAEFTTAERKRHIFCTNCWNETNEKISEIC